MFTGKILFLTVNKRKALVKETRPNATFPWKIVFVEGDFSNKRVGDVIYYTYDKTFVGNNGYNITLV